MSNNQSKPDLHPDWIDSHAIGIVKALQKAGHTSYLVGGCVRDLLLGIHPKDYDIATAAHPPQVKRLIHMAFIIGKRFRLVLVKRGEQQFEVATFRREFDPNEFPAEQYPDGPPSVENIFGSPEEDAKRRDFTVNALFYDPISGDLIDYVNGRPDIEGRVLRMIGDPAVRLVEDPIRILRALRFAHKLNFVIEPTLRAGMIEYASGLTKAVLPRRREELLKLLRLANPALSLIECHDLGVLKHIFPTLEKMFETSERQEMFLSLFEATRESVLDFNNTGQLFGWLIYSITETLRETGARLNEEELGVFMRDELGMYKFEQSLVVEAFKMIGTLQKAEEFRRRGERRQNGLVRREGFQLALRLAIADYKIGAEDSLFWTQLFERSRPEIEAAAEERKANASRRKRRPRKPRGDRGSGDSDTDQDPSESASESASERNDEDASDDDSTHASRNETDPNHV